MSNSKMEISFSPPDISEEEVAAVSAVLRGGWLTTGGITHQFEAEVARWAGVPAANCVSFGSCTAALEMCLRALGLGPGDEVITTAYTYTATAAVVCHVGATLRLVDCLPDSYEIDYDAVAAAITPRTKAVIPVDVGGVMCDYQRLRAAAPGITLIADGAHSIGATYRGAPSGSCADFTAFSFHAVKNVTCGEGGALVWRADAPLPATAPDAAAFAKQLRLLSLHGQSKDAFSKNQAGNWEYDIVAPLYKCNLTDIQAALGLAQLKRYPQMLARRRQLAARYEQELSSPSSPGPTPSSPGLSGGSISSRQLDRPNKSGNDDFIWQTPARIPESSCHLELLQVPERDRVIAQMAADGIATNVHYKPLPLLTAYKDLGFDIADYPNAYRRYQHELTLPLYSKMTDAEQDYIIESFNKAL
jgi:dTDP-4-amino-4,6-dideoxygalactose transaminase